MLPAIIAVLVVVGLLVSNYQKEVGLAEPNKGGCAAVAAATVALELATEPDGAGYAAFSDALLVATVARRNVPITNPADIRLDHELADALDCLSAGREAWQTEIDQTWDPETHGTAVYWRAMHPSVDLSGEQAVTSAVVRRVACEQAHEILKEAAELAE